MVITYNFPDVVHMVNLDGIRVNQPRLPPHDPAQMISISSNADYSNKAVGHAYNIPAPEHPLLAIRLLISQLLCPEN